MTELKKTATSFATLETRPAPEPLFPFVKNFVYRDEKVDGSVVRILPEMRSSVQLRLADPYWIRERDSSASWRRIPDLSIWAPRYNWGYGYASSHIKVFAFDLTPAGFRAIVGQNARGLTDSVLDATSYDSLQNAVAMDERDCFHAWAEHVSNTLTSLFQNADPTPIISAEALEMLATAGGGGVSKAAALEGVSPRQFRRRFVAFFGIGPKQYQRFVRVDRQIRSLHPDPWEHDEFQPAPISFADQPHAIREFRDTIGMTPLQYQQRKSNADRTLRSVSEPKIPPPAEAS